MSDKIIQAVNLACQEGNHDKVYNLQLVEVDGGYNVAFQYGRRGSTLNAGVKNKTPVTIEAAQKIYAGILKEKTSKTPPYKVTGSAQPVSGASPVAKNVVGFVTPVQAPANDDTFVPHLLLPIDESDIEKYLKDDSYVGQEKKDGKHLTLKKIGTEITVRNKKGKAIPFSKELETVLLGLPCNIHLDIEAIGDTYHVFDLMEYDGKDWKGEGYLSRMEWLQGVSKDFGAGLVIVPVTVSYTAKKALYERLKKEGKEGIVFKRKIGTYQPGARDERMLKAKFYKELSARVASCHPSKRSIGLELLDDTGKWVFMGNCTIGGTKPIPAEGTICEIKYLYAYKGGALYQPSFKEPRDDVDESECLMSQVKYKAEEN
jgi:bifunctional non-homologous end joining protein LigD